MRIVAGCLAVLVAVALAVWFWRARSHDTDVHPAHADASAEQIDTFDAGTARTPTPDAGIAPPRSSLPALDASDRQGQRLDGGAAAAQWAEWPRNCGFDARGG